MNGLEKEKQLRKFIYDTLVIGGAASIITITDKFREIAICFAFSAANDPDAIVGKSTEELTKEWEDFVYEYFKWDKNTTKE